MKDHASAGKENGKSVDSPPQPSFEAGNEAIALAPPAYGIQFVDLGLLAGAFSAGPLHTGGAIPVLQRKCACGVGASSSTGECAECSKKKLGLQAKLRIGKPDDAYEQEADRVAEQVMRMPEPVGEAAVYPRRGAQKETSVQSKTGRAWESSGSVTDGFTKSLGPGLSLSSVTRAFFEPRFGQDFSDVRVHANGQAAEAARSIDAKAFTVGQAIAFGASQYAPESQEGRELLAHELAHVDQGHTSSSRLWRKPKGTVELGQPTINAPEPEEQEEWVRLQVWVTDMDHAALLLAQGNLTFKGAEKRNLVFVGLDSKFVKVYDKTGKALGNRVALKEVKGLVFQPGVYVQGPKGIVALTTSRDDKQISAEAGPSIIGSRPHTAEEKAAIAEEGKKATTEKRQPKPARVPVLDFEKILTEPERFKSMVATVPDALVLYFVPTIKGGARGKGGDESKTLYASPIEGRGDGQPANAPPWPVDVEGPKLVPIKANPTYAAKVNWTANSNYTLASQVISQVGETIHYKWERYDITKYAKEQIAKDPAGTREDAASKPEKTLDERIDEFKTAKRGTGPDVTGMGGANREFTREFDDWWKDTKRASKGTVEPSGTVRERLSNKVANELTLELAPVSLLVTAVGAALKWVAELFAGPRQQQEVPMDKEGIFLIRVISTPGIHEDTEGKSIVRPPSVAAKVTEVTPIEKAVKEALDEPGAQMAELQSQIDLAQAAGNKAKADYLRSLFAEAKERYEGSPLTILIKKRDAKQKELEEFRKNYPTLSDYSRAREVEMLNDQIGRYEHHEKEQTKGATNLAPLKRINATLISEVTGEQYPLLMSAGPMAMDDGQYQWIIGDVTNREGDPYTGLGVTRSAAFLSALTKFGNKAAYGRGRIGVCTAGLGLEDGAVAEMMVDSAPADWALAEKRLDDLVTTLALLGLIVASAGTAGAVIGAGVAAARLVQRWQAGRLSLDPQTLSDVLGVLGGIGVAGQLAGGLRIQKFEKAFVITQEGRATEAQIARAAEALKGAQELSKAVEIANEAMNYGGSVWGNIQFIDQMMDINEQERTGAITHAAARRARASAISAAVQSNGLFIAGNVMKAKQAAKEKTPAAPEKARVEKTPPEVTKPTEPPATKEPGAKEPTETLPEEAGKPAQKAGEAVPIGERRATLAELQAVLPKDLEHMVVIDDTPNGDTVKADYTLDPETGLISEIELRCSPDARPETVRLHTETIRTMQKYQGFSGRVRQVISFLADLVGVGVLDPKKDPATFEAKLEIDKLPKLIEEQMTRMKDMEPNARNTAEAELEKLKLQLDQNIRKLETGTGQAVGFVASLGLSKAKRARYVELAGKLRELKTGTDQHKAVRREMYESIGGDLSYEAWEKKVYRQEVEGAAAAAAAARAEQKAPPSKGDWPALTQDIQKGIDTAATRLRKQLGKQWLDPSIYGTRLHAEFARIAKTMKLPPGWRAVVETPLRNFGGIDPKTLNMTVEAFVKGRIPEYFGLFPESLLNRRIGNIEPDLVLVAPDGSYVVWDLAPGSADEHLAKTLLYAHVVGESGRATVGESYYKWQQHISVNSAKQATFTTAGSRQSVVTIPEKQILSLLKDYAGQGTPLSGLPAGVSGASELITANKKVVGQYYDPKTRRLVDTANFSIHYSEGGLFIRPEAP